MRMEVDLIKAMEELDEKAPSSMEFWSEAL